MLETSTLLVLTYDTMRSVETSPFVFDGPAPPADVVGRDEELAGLWDRAMHGRFVVLSAPRRYGKTSVIHRLRHDATTGDDLAVVLVDLYGTQTLGDVAARIGRAYRALPDAGFGAALRRLARRLPHLAAQLGFGPVTARIEAARRHDEERPVLDDLLALPWEAAGVTGQRVLVVLDEFQAVARIADAPAIIRASIQHQRDRVSYLFAGSERSLLDTIFSERAAPLYGQAEQVRLGPLASEALGDLIDSKFAATGRHADDALAPLLALSDGHPQRAMLLAHHLWEATSPAGTADYSTFESALDDALTHCRAEFDAIGAQFGPGAAKTARLLAWGEPPLGAAAARIGLAKGTARGGLLALDRVSLIDDEHRIVDPLWAEHLRRLNPQP